MPTAPTAPSACPEFPALSNRVNYNSLAFIWAGHMRVTYSTEMAALAANTYANAVEAATSAGTATDKAGIATAAAAAAAATAGALPWVSAQTYAFGANAISLANARTYRRLIPGAGTTDPASDAVNWTPVIPEVTPFSNDAALEETTAISLYF